MSAKGSEPDELEIPPRVLKRMLEDSTLLDQVSDRVYELLRHELKQQRQRQQGYGRRF